MSQMRSSAANNVCLAYGDNPESKLAEIAAREKRPFPKFTIGVNGPSHCPEYTAEVKYAGTKFRVHSANTKKLAKRALACLVLSFTHPELKDAPLSSKSAKDVLDKIKAVQNLMDDIHPTTIPNDVLARYLAAVSPKIRGPTNKVVTEHQAAQDLKDLPSLFSKGDDSSDYEEESDREVCTLALDTRQVVRLISVLDNAENAASRESDALIRNKLVHALNGNGDTYCCPEMAKDRTRALEEYRCYDETYIQLMSHLVSNVANVHLRNAAGLNLGHAYDHPAKSIEDIRKRQVTVLASQFGRVAFPMGGYIAYKALRNRLADQWFDCLACSVLEEEANAHNVQMHSLNGNMQRWMISDSTSVEDPVRYLSDNELLEFAQALQPIVLTKRPAPEVDQTDKLAKQPALKKTFTQTHLRAATLGSQRGILDALAATHNRDMHAKNGNNPETVVTTKTVTTKPKQNHKQKFSKKEKKPKSKKAPKPKKYTGKPKHVATVSTLVAKNAVGKVQRIVENLTMPMEHPGVRIKLDYENVETAVGSPNDQFDAEFIQNESVGFFFKDSIRASLTPKAITDESSYIAMFDNGHKGTSDLVDYIYVEGPKPAADYWVNPAHFKSNAGQAPHGEKLYTGVSKLVPELRWFPMTYTGVGSATITVQATAVGVSSDSQELYVALYRYNNTGTPDIADQNTASMGSGATFDLSANADTNAPMFAYYALAITFPDLLQTQNYTVNLSLVQQPSTIFAQRPIPGWEDNKTVAGMIAVNGFSTWLSNNASDLSKNGRILAVQVPANFRPQNIFVPGATYDALGKFASRFPTPAKTGFYGFYRPSGVNSFFFAEYTPDRDETFKMESKQDYLAVVANCIAGTDGTGQNLQWTRSYAVEFRTADTWRPQRQAQSTPRDLEAALEVMSKIPQFHENPVHIKAIAGRINSFIGKAIGFVNKYGPLASSVLGMMA